MCEEPESAIAFLFVYMLKSYLISFMSRELGIGIVAYSPLGRGFLASGTKLVENLEHGDPRKASTRLIHFSAPTCLSIVQYLT